MPGPNAKPRLTACTPVPSYASRGVLAEESDRNFGRETAMTGCIVGWAHTPFGRLDTETRGEPDRAGRDRRARGRRYRAVGRRRDRARALQRRLLGAGLHRLAGAAGLARPALQACDPGRERLRDRFGGRASGPARARGEGGAHRARGRRRADDHDAGPRDRTEPAQGVLRAATRPTIEGGFAGVFGKIAAALFPEIRRPVRRARA